MTAAQPHADITPDPPNPSGKPPVPSGAARCDLPADPPAPGGREKPRPKLTTSTRPHAGSSSSIPAASVTLTTPQARGGEDGLTPIRNPELRAAFMAAHRAWAIRYQPHLLERWLDD